MGSGRRSDQLARQGGDLATFGFAIPDGRRFARDIGLRWRGVPQGADLR
jgi:hypothetical protein